MRKVLCLRRDVASAASLVCGLAVACVLGCGGGNNNTSTGPAPSPPAAACSTSSGAANVPVPSNCAYFGAWVNPAGSSTSPSDVASYTAALESQIGRKLALHMHYYSWGTANATASLATPSFPDQAVLDDAAAGRTPVITWSCGNLNGTVATASPTVDTPDYNLIVATAQAVRSFGKPLYLRWNWEMNLNSGTKCMGSGTAAQQATGYIAAWQNIYNIFKAQGVTNVSWLWNPAGAATDPDPAPFYPGSAYVDWVGFDGYDKVAANDFGAILSHFYQEFSPDGKPMLVAETGECPGVQQSYLALATAEVAGRANAGNYSFPLVKGFMYFDSPGQFKGCSWSLDAGGTSAFAAMGADGYFAAAP